MADNNSNNHQDTSVWARVALMGHVELAGQLSKPEEWGGLWQLDIPEGDGFRTKLFSVNAVYDIDIVSEQIARAYATQSRSIIAYDAPIVTREEHVAAMERARQEYSRLEQKVGELERRLTAVNALPAPAPKPGEEVNPFELTAG